MSREWTGNDLVHRQVNKAFWSEGGPLPDAFYPQSRDEGKLFVDDGAMVSAEGSWRHFNEVLGLKSVGTWALSVLEICGREALQLRRDPIESAEDPAKNNPAHCLIDFTAVVTKAQKKYIVQTLAIKARQHGCQYQPVEQEVVQDVLAVSKLAGN